MEIELNEKQNQEKHDFCNEIFVFIQILPFPSDFSAKYRLWENTFSQVSINSTCKYFTVIYILVRIALQDSQRLVITVANSYKGTELANTVCWE